MLDDFGQTRAGSGRFGASLVASVAIIGGAGAAIVVASTWAHAAILEDTLVQVEFAPPPPAPELPPPPPPPQAASAPAARLGRPRPQLQVPQEIPAQRPAESRAPLTPPDDPFGDEPEGDPNGTADGVVGGVPGGTGGAAPAAPATGAVGAAGPQRVIEGTSPPEVNRDDIIRNLVVPEEARRAGIARITVVVRVTLDAEGRVQRVDVLRGHALIPEENIVAAVRAARFTPARMRDGTAYAAIHTLPITIAFSL